MLNNQHLLRVSSNVHKRKRLETNDNGKWRELEQKLLDNEKNQNLKRRVVSIKRLLKISIKYAEEFIIIYSFLYIHKQILYNKQFNKKKDYTSSSRT